METLAQTGKIQGLNGKRRESDAQIRENLLHIKLIFTGETLNIPHHKTFLISVIEIGA